MTVYVCVTLYHVYITMLMIFNSGNDKKRNFILLNANNEEVYKQYTYIYSKLIQNGYLCDVRLRKKGLEIIGVERIKNRKQLKLIYDSLQDIDESDFTLVNYAWNNSYVYSTASLLYKKCNEAVFVEESTLIAKLGDEKPWKKLLHQSIGDIVDFYRDDKLKKILVQKPETFPVTWKNKLQFLDIESMIKKLSNEAKMVILNIMSQEGVDLIDLIKEPGTGIVYTCPFSEQGLISEEEKIQQVLAICNHYKKYGKVLLKLHPRDLSKYPVAASVKIMSGGFPSELLALIDYKFKFAVSVCSSAVHTTNAEYKVNMNENFYNNPEFVLRGADGKIVGTKDLL